VLFAVLYKIQSAKSDVVSENSSKLPIQNAVLSDTSIKEGKASFMLRCASCHSIFKDMTGPALKDINKKWPDRKRLNT
jgi:cytochrome c551/c552